MITADRTHGDTLCILSMVNMSYLEVNAVISNHVKHLEGGVNVPSRTKVDCMIYTGCSKMYAYFPTFLSIYPSVLSIFIYLCMYLSIYLSDSYKDPNGK